ncbi:hypothetical protein Slin15195_G078090 [Septoria linicola]|uniref:2EXR domain-containing protein n=1 Tax=Septoria linicola TaxID=215465 RepID=A0A9Q9AXV0_9PEZI|nr:hypothetical protein Slin14017_G039280 [Septoria linicola]USW54490.1 hypothetical protein Slin15195_G078090 [Septoria linicola]
MSASSTAPLARWRREIANRDSPLIKLPPELRNMIYEMVMPIDTTFKPISGCTFQLEQDCLEWVHRPDTETGTNALMHVCRQVRAEAIKLYFASNTFILGTNPLLGNAPLWLESIGIQALSSLRQVGFFVRSRQNLGCAWWSDEEESVHPDCEMMLCILDIPKATVRHIKDEDACSCCNAVHARLISKYNDAVELLQLRQDGESSTMLPSDRKDLLLQIRTGLAAMANDGELDTLVTPSKEQPAYISGHGRPMMPLKEVDVAP